MLRLTVALALVLADSIASAAVPPAERNALVELYNATSGPSWKNATTWCIGDPCDNKWYGIFCNTDNTHVVEVFPNPRHSGNVMKGAIPPSFWTDLPQLVHIYLSNDVPGGWSSLTG